MCYGYLVLFSALVLASHCVIGQISNGSLRLTGGVVPWDGRLEVYYEGQWGTVCDDGFSEREAGIACWQMGYSALGANFSTIGVDVDNPPILLDDLHCDGSEPTLAQCDHRPWGQNDCKAVEHVALTCIPDPCRSSPCLNGGTCIALDDVNTTCSCDRWHTGQLCEADMNFCDIHNGGCSHECVNDGAGQFHCACPDGLTLNEDLHSCHAPDVSVSCGPIMEVAFTREAWPGLHEQYMALLNSSCPAQGNETHVFATIPLSGCGTTAQAVSDGYVFENVLMTRDVPVGGLVSRVRDVRVTVRCHYHDHSLLDNFYIVNTGLIRFSDVAQGHYQLSMDLFHNGNQFVAGGAGGGGGPVEKLEPGEDLSLKFSLSSNDTSLQVFARNCRARPSSDAAASQYLFLDEGCSKDSSLRQNQSAPLQETLQLQAFQFLQSNSSSLLLHCDVVVCNVSDPTSRCSQGCLSGSDRSSWVDQSEVAFQDAEAAKEAGQQKSSSAAPIGQRDIARAKRTVQLVSDSDSYPSGQGNGLDIETVRNNGDSLKSATNWLHISALLFAVLAYFRHRT